MEILETQSFDYDIKKKLVKMSFANGGPGGGGNTIEGGGIT